MMMPHTATQRLTIALPPVGVALLLTTMVLPAQVAVVAWGLAMVMLLTALACALIAESQRRAERARALVRTKE